MHNHYSVIIFIDAVINLIIGVALLLYPLGSLNWFGLPAPGNGFYPLILGAVIFGIGLALVVELLYGKKGLRGLGLHGAIVINLCGGGVLLLWLVVAEFNLPNRGIILLWAVAILVLLTGITEITLNMVRRKNPRS